MDDYIKREALRDALYDADAITMNGVKILNQFPSSDVEPGDKVKLRYNNKDSKHPKVDNSLYIYFDKNTGHEYTADGLLSTFSVFLARKN